MIPRGNRYGDVILVLSMLAWMVPVFFVIRGAQHARRDADATQRGEGPGPERPLRAEGPGPERPLRAEGPGPERPLRAEGPGPERPGATEKVALRRTSRSTGLILGGVLTAVLVAVLVGVTWNRTDYDSSPFRTVDADRIASFTSARDGVCEVAKQARSEKTADIKDTSFHRVRQPLLDLAATADATDRWAAARVLETTAVIEDRSARAARSLADELDGLAIAAGRALAAVGGSDPGPCQA